MATDSEPDIAQGGRAAAPARRSRTRLRVLGFAAAVVVLAGIGWMVLPVGAWLRHFATWVGRFGTMSGAVYVTVYLIGAAVMVPSAVLSTGAGLVFGVWGIAIAMAGALLGAAATFLASRYLARGYVGARARRHRHFAAIDHAIGEEGWKVVALIRLSPMPYSFSNYLFGATRIGFWPYLAATTAGLLPWTVAFVWIGAAGRTAFAATGKSGATTEWILLGAGLAAAVAVAVLVTRAARRRLRQAGL